MDPRERHMPQVKTLQGSRPSRSPRKNPQARLRRWALKSLGGALVLGIFFQAGAWLWKRSWLATQNLLQQAGFRVQALWVEGRSRTSLQALRQAVGISRGTFVADISLESLRERVLRLPWVRTAVITRSLPGTLCVHLTERVPLALWQKHGKKYLLDTQGLVIPCPESEYPPSLLTVVGENAPHGTRQLLHMLRAFPQFCERVQAASRLRNGRWDLYLKDKTLLKLPLQEAKCALKWFLSLEARNLLSTRSFTIIDLRFPDRLIVQERTPPLAPPKSV